VAAEATSWSRKPHMSLKTFDADFVDGRTRCKLAQGFGSLIAIEPMCAAIMSNLAKVYTPSIASLGTDGQHLFVSPDFVSRCQPSELTLWLVRQAVHIASGHQLRRGDRETSRWGKAAQVAADLVIVDAARENRAFGIQVLPNAPELAAEEDFRGLAAEQIYDLLPSSGDGFAVVFDYPGTGEAPGHTPTPANLLEGERARRSVLVQAIQMAKRTDKASPLNGRRERKGQAA